jgi:phage terminase small subunit
MSNLTPKQEAFCLAYIETGNASEAYRRAYNAGKMKPEVIAVKACELLKSGNVSVRVSELQAAAAERSAITVDDLIAELEEARAAAAGAPNPQSAAMVAATMGKAKLLGFLVEKVNANVVTQALPASVDEFV